MTFEIPTISREELRNRIKSNLLGTRYNYVTTRKGSDGNMYDIYINLDYNKNMVAVLESDFGEI